MGKYEEALERARAGKPIDEVFLELKESKDERIRKAALEGIEYLERKLGWDAIGDTDILDVKEYLERQKEQEPAEWSEEDEEIREEVIGDLCALKDWIVKYDVNWLANPVLKSIDKRISWLKALHSDSYKNCNSRWKPSDEHPEGGCSEKPNDLLSEPEADLEKVARDVYESWMGGTMNDVRRDIVELGKVLNARKEEKSQPSLPSNLDEAAEEYEKRAMEDYDEICVNEDGSECPVLKCDFKDAFKAGAEWMAGQFQKIEGDLVDWHSTSDGKEYCCGIKTDEAFEIPEGFYIQKKQQPGESLKENEDGNK